jgi:hypothetical protein
MLDRVMETESLAIWPFTNVRCQTTPCVGCIGRSKLKISVFSRFKVPFTVGVNLTFNAYHPLRCEVLLRRIGRSVAFYRPMTPQPQIIEHSAEKLSIIWNHSLN